MKAGRLPVFGTADVLMFNRIEVDIVKVGFKIFFVANDMFPKPRLPKAASSLSHLIG